MTPRELAVIAAGLALGVASLAIARAHPGGSFGGTSVAAGIALCGAGWALVGAGLVASRRAAGRFGATLAAAGFAWLLAEFDNPGVGSGAAFTIGLLAFAACTPLVAHAALTVQTGSLADVERVALGLAYLSALGLLGLASALVFDPARQLCSLCPANLLAVTDEPGLVAAFQRDGLWLGLVAIVALALLVARRIVRSSPAARLATAPVLAAAVAYLALAGVDHAHSLRRGFLSNDALEERLWLGQSIALAALVAGVVLAWARGRRARDTMAGIVLELGAAPAPAGLRDALAQALGDPELELAYPLGSGRHVDAAGRAIDIAAKDGRAMTPLVRGGRPVAVLVHRAELLDDPAIVKEIGAATQLALEHERLEAELRAQLETLRASRARTVAAGDAERRRLERDLHDGAQQRLVVLSIGLHLLRSELDPQLAGRLDGAEAELRGALEDLRQLGRGMYPAVLADEGLAAAVESLAEDSAVPVVVGALPAGRLAAPVEAAAYFLVAEVVRRSREGRLLVTGSLTSGCLLICITGAPDLRGDLVDLEDRIGALDGTLSIEQREGERLAVRAKVPCG